MEIEIIEIAPNNQSGIVFKAALLYKVKESIKCSSEYIDSYTYSFYPSVS